MFGFCQSDSNIPIAHLDYNYIGECKDTKELEKLLKILRSGEEGHYPELIKFTEKRLQEFKPQSKLLLKENKVKTIREIGKDEGSMLLEDIQEWSDHMAHIDKDILETTDSLKSNPDVPPVRVAAVNREPNINSKVENSQRNSQKPAAPRSYNEWDRFDVDKEVKKVDEFINKDSGEGTRIQNVSMTASSNIEVAPDMTHDERSIKANNEKDKGNEAFRSGDFSEALVYYNRSILFQKSPPLFNNRAITYIKLERFEDAIKDCELVLAEEPTNIKAYLRRGLALKSLKRYKQALKDFERVLELAPTNKRAQSLVDEVKKALKDTANNIEEDQNTGSVLNGKETMERPRGKRLVIEEVENVKEEKKLDKAAEKNSSKRGKRLKIVEVEDIDNSESNKSELIDSSKVNDGSDVKSNADHVSNDRSTSKVAEKESGSEGASIVNDEKNCLTSEKKSKTENFAAEMMETGMKTSDALVLAPEKQIVAVPKVEPVLAVPEDVVVLKDDGNTFYKAGRYVEAREKYSKAIEILSKVSKGHEASIAILLSNRAICRYKIGDCKGCVEDATKSLKMAPTAKALLRRAAAFEIIENYRQSYIDYQDSLRLDNGLQAAWSGTSRLANLLKSRDGSGWREKLPKSGSYVKLNQYNSIVNGTESKKNEAVGKESGISSKDEKSSEDHNKETVEEKFKRIKETGNKFVQKKMFSDAVNCYTQCIDLLPSEIACYTNRSLCYLKLDKPEDAEMDASKALNLQNDNVKALFRRASARKILKKYADALEDLRELLVFDRTNVAAKKEIEAIKKLLIEASTERASIQSTKVATSEINDEAKKTSGPKIVEEEGAEFNPRANNKEEKIENQFNEGSNVKESYKDDKKETKKKGRKLKIIEVEEIDDINKIGKENVEENKSLSSNDMSKKTDGHKRIEEVESIESSCSTEKSSLEYAFIVKRLKEVPDDVMKLVDEGNHLIEIGKYANAIECYTEAISTVISAFEHNKESLAVMYNNRAACKWKIGDTKGCIEDATKSLESDISSNAYVNRAIAYESVEKYKHAYVDYLEALKIDSSVKTAWDASTRLIGVLRNQDGPRWRDQLPKHDMPQKKLQQPDAKQPDPKQPVANQPDPKQPVAKDLEVKQWEENIDEDDLDTALKKKPESKEDKFKRIKELGNKCVQQGKYQEATNYYSQCIDLFPDEATSFTNRALCYLKLNKPKKAEIDCSKALGFQPDNIKALFRRSLAKKASGKYKDALHDLTGLLKLDPQNGAAKKELELIKDLWREELKNVTSKPIEKSQTKETLNATQQKAKKGRKIEEIPTKKAKETSQRDESQVKMPTKDSIQRSPRKLHLKKASGFEFLKAWNELKGRSLRDHADLLSQIEPTQLPKVISNKIDGEMIQTIVSCVHGFFMTKDKLLHGFNILRYTGKADRFNMGIMFLSTNDLSKIKRVIEDVEGKLKDSNLNVTAKEVSELKKTYKVT